MLRFAALFTVFCLGATPFAWGQQKPPAPAVPAERFIEQLGERDFRIRDAASKALEKLGPDALPALRKAKEHADAEIRRRVSELIPALERTALLTPKLITLRMNNKSIRDAVAAISKQSGYPIDLWPEARFNGGREQSVFNFQLDNVPFWKALDHVCSEGGLSLQDHGGNDGRIRLQFQDTMTPFIHHRGPFRIVAHGFNYSRNINFAQLPRNGTPVGQRSEFMNFTLAITSEPRLPLLGVGQIKLNEARDDRGSSMLMPEAENNGYVANYPGYNGYKTFMQQAQVNLARPSQESSLAKVLKGTVPITLLTEQRPDIIIDPILKAKNKKAKSGTVELTVESVNEIQGQPKCFEVKLSISDTRKDNTQDYTWVNSLYQRIELHDAKGNRFMSRGFNWGNSTPTSMQGAYQFGDPGNGAIGAPAKLVYYTWVTMQHQVDFEFQNLPLP